MRDYSDIKVKAITAAYNKVMQRIDKSSIQPNDEAIEKIKNKICIAESKILKIIEYDFDIQIASDFLDILLKRFSKKEISEQLYYITKIIILDSYRTHACLVYKP